MPREQTAVTLQRQQLAAAGFDPLPLNGKAPSMLKGWQDKFAVGNEEIAAWARTWPAATNTGVLCKLAPAIDIDIMHGEAADAIEALAREHFEERGDILVRTGKAPKRAILLRTDAAAAFAKLSRVFTGPDGREHKIEILASGQQVVVAGIHPETKKPYSWHGGEPGAVKREDLPYVREADVAAFLDAAAVLLGGKFGFVDKGGSKQAPPPGAATGARMRSPPRESLDWGVLFSRIQAGENLHDSITALAASFVANGMSDKAAIERLQSLMAASKAQKDARWRDRYAEIPRAVRSARIKFAADIPGATDDGEDHRPATIRWHGDIDPRDSRPQLVQDIIPAVGCGLASGQWGTFKTFTAFDLAHCVMSGEPFLGGEIMRRGGVLFIALEGTDEVAIRLQGVIDHKGTLVGRAPIAWAETCPPLIDQNAAADLVKLAVPAAERLKTEFGLPLSLITIDTMVAAAGFSSSGEENDAALGQAMMNTLRQVAIRLGCFVLGVDHFGKAVETGTRGTSAKEGAADVVLALLGDKSISGEVTNTRLALRKRRGGANGQEFPFQPRVIDMGVDRFGKAMSPLVIDWGAAADTPSAAKEDTRWSKSLRLLRQVLMNVLVDHGKEQQPYLDGPTVRAVNVELVRREFYRSYLADGDTEAKKAEARKKAFKRAIADAQAKGVIGLRDLGGGEIVVWLATKEPPASGI